MANSSIGAYARLPNNRAMRISALPPIAPRRGFTLIEAMITTVVIAILAALAYPSFQQSIYKSRRSDAVAGLTVIQQAQERYRANQIGYATTLDASGLKLADVTPDKHYSLALSDVTATGYTATARVSSTSPQASDAACASMSVTMASGNFSYSSADSGGVTSSGSSNPCWVR